MRAGSNSGLTSAPRWPKGDASHFLLLAALAKSGLRFKEISPAYLTPADGRAAFIGGNLDAWAASGSVPD